jgi:hypothetical protein
VFEKIQMLRRPVAGCFRVCRPRGSRLASGSSWHLALCSPFNRRCLLFALSFRFVFWPYFLLEQQAPQEERHSQALPSPADDGGTHWQGDKVA